ncbi:unnamed protein product [Adineta steineri]|uniref:Uncharacterized protein n=1 Tax=Adineta steineri TaxID=433720 RepID=A0A820CKJ2_9BILA|nr:unnamed protein product [Adineta steineri]CAF4223808.1 unnamed protein product [Adineta steineri]
MIVSSVLAVVLRPARIDREQCDRLYAELCRFQRMQSPCILPFTWLVPLELPILKCNDQVVSSDQWIEKMFTVDESSNNLGTTQQKELQKGYDFIRQTLPKIDVANLTYLPHEMKDNAMTLKTMKTTMNSKSSKNYHASLTEMIKKFMDTQGKQLPDKNFKQSVNAAQAKLNSYTDPEELFVKIKYIYKNVQNEEEQTRIISEETDKRLKTIVDRICREEMINQAIDGQELQCELERCRTCHRQAGIVSIIHQCSNGRHGNFYRYDDNRMKNREQAEATEHYNSHEDYQC